MRTYRRAIGPALLAAAFLITFAGAARAGGEAGGDITFRLTLRGEVVDGDAFTLGIIAIDNKTIISPGTLCGPGVLEPRAPLPCGPDSYEFVLEGRDVIPLGTQLEYGWARVDGDGEDTILYRGTATVTRNAQVLTLVYDYGGGSQLPDTAMRASDQPVPLGLAVVIGSLVMLGGVATATRRQGRQLPTP